MPTSPNPSKLKKFLEPLNASELRQSPCSSHNSHFMQGVPSHLQVPHTDRSELAAFLSPARGGANILSPNAPRSPNEKCTPLKAVLQRAMEGKAELPEVPSTPPPPGFKRVYKYAPESFHCGRVKRPRVTSELVPEAPAPDDGLMLPSHRRQLHEESLVNKRAEQAFAERAAFQKKLEQKCRFQHPHGVLGCESPYNGASQVYAEQHEEMVAAENRRARKQKGGSEDTYTATIKQQAIAHDGTIGSLLANQHAKESFGQHRAEGKGTKMNRPRDTLLLA